MPSRHGGRRPAGGRPSPAPAAAPATPHSSPTVTVATDKPELLTLLQALEGDRGSRVIAYWMTPFARISDAASLPLYDSLRAIGRVPRIDLYLFTAGGDTEVPWRMVSLIREYTDHFTVLIPHRAHSSGTLLALGADQIVMTPLSILGPIDPTRAHPLLPRVEGADEPEAVSVQDMRHAMQFIREPAGPGSGVAYTPEAMAQIFTALFDKVHPLAIGAIEQAYALAKLIGTNCLSTHMDPATQGAEIKRIVDTLCDEYKSHAYQLSRREARELGLPVIDAPPSTEAAMSDLMLFYLRREAANPAPQPRTPWRPLLAWMDSTTGQFRVESEYDVASDGKAKHKGDRWVPY